MTTFLLVVSLLLNGVTIFAIIILFTRQNRLLEVEKRQETWIKDVEEIISSSLFEMKEENEAFIHRFQKISSQTSTLISSKIPEEEMKNVDEPFKTEMMKKTGNAIKQQAVKAYQESYKPNSGNNGLLSGNNNKVEKMIIPDATSENKPELTQEEIYRDLFINQVQILQKQGLSAEDIAKKLGKGRTEIELLLKFSRNVL
jgi:hypothetical protein